MPETEHPEDLSSEQLLPLVYEELRRLATSGMSSQAAGLFEASVVIDDRVERTAFLDHVCHGDPALRTRLAGLLESTKNSATFPVPARLALDSTSMRTRLLRLS